MAKVVPVREFRRNLAALMSDVAERRDHVVVTRNGKPAAVLLPVDEYESLEETAEVLSDPGTMAAIEEGLAAAEKGDVVPWEDVRAELAERRAKR